MHDPHLRVPEAGKPMRDPHPLIAVLDVERNHERVPLDVVGVANQGIFDQRFDVRRARVQQVVGERSAGQGRGH
ncbi:MAG: hypothetical protein A3H29_14160 [Acidobacteria bacterium RIFCSPLOWO2_02_FULL_67_21]|nr:MAG: hypothetical protein A3H29_14160 [Acidobacteria bacterium RIFCSPLOWO2_02_FULL_67_21]